MVRQPAFGQAQLNFVTANRAEADKLREGHFKERDWRIVVPPGGRCRCAATKKKVSVDLFHVKPLAVFVPHLLLKNHVPCCPKCESSKSVHTEGPRVKWVKVPKILVGTNSHNCLDTKRHWCSHCWSSFLGYDKQSMHLDAHKWTGFFNFLTCHPTLLQMKQSTLASSMQQINLQPKCNNNLNPCRSTGTTASNRAACAWQLLKKFELGIPTLLHMTDLNPQSRACLRKTCRHWKEDAVTSVLRFRCQK